MKDRKDIMSYLLAAKDPESGQNLQLAEVWSEAYLMISAGKEDCLVKGRPAESTDSGGDTTATAISSTFFYLTRNLEAYQKVTEEIRTTFASFDSIIRGPALTSCVYLRACLQEAMRMSPSAPGATYPSQ